VIVWRITRERFQALDGEGARLNGGRWNSEGNAVVYTSCSLSLAALEYLVHIDPEDVPSDLIAMQIEIPDSVGGDGIPVSDLPRDWSAVPDHPECILRGDAWLRESRTLFLRVLSAVVPEEENILLNPAHADAALLIVLQTRPFAFAPRLLA
jgi:RES domain-containing protein